MNDINDEELGDPPEIVVPDKFLSEKAGAIRALGKGVIRNVIEIGRHLSEAKVRCRHGEWLPWLKREFAWSRQTADNFMNAYAATRDKLPNFSNLSLDVSSLYLLAAPSTPAEVRDELLDKAASGDAVTREDVQKAIDKALAKQLSDFEANLADARKEADEREASVRSEYAGKMFVDQDELGKIIDKQLKPFQRRIADYQARIESMQQADLRRREREKKAREKKGEIKKGPRIDQDMAFRCTAIHSALKDLALTMAKMTPAEMVTTEKIAIQVTGQTLEGRIGDSANYAKHTIDWLQLFLKLTKP